MNKGMIVLMLVIVGGLLGALFGITNHNYTVNKCSYLVQNDNPSYGVYPSCYLLSERPNLDLFLRVISFSLLGFLVVGSISLVIYLYGDRY